MGIQYIRKKRFTQVIVYKWLENFYLDKKKLVFLLELMVNMSMVIKFDFEYNTIGLISLMFITTSFLFKKFRIRFSIIFYVFFPTLLMLNTQIYTFSYYHIFSAQTKNHLEKFSFLSFFFIREENI